MKTTQKWRKMLIAGLFNTVLVFVLVVVVGCGKKAVVKAETTDLSSSKLITYASEVWTSTDSNDLILWAAINIGGMGAGSEGAEQIWFYENEHGLLRYNSVGEYATSGEYEFSYKLSNDNTIEIDFLDEDGNSRYIGQTVTYEITQDNILVLTGSLYHPGRGQITVTTKYGRTPWYN